MRLDQFAIGSLSIGAHFASSFSPSRISCAVSRPRPRSRGRGDGGARLRLAVAEIDQRRDRIAHRLRRALVSTAPDSRITAGSRSA
jgi:hypothetical protein